MSAGRLGGYELLRPLAEGGMAEVFVARSPVGRRVALKRVRSDLASDPKFAELFLREARIAIGLEHPNIAHVLDVGEAEGSYFLVMELVEGISLLALDRAAAARDQRLPVPVVAWIFERVARALHHAHERRDASGEPLGIVHRDVSPQNILLAEDGGVKLIDFGVARATNSATLTRPGVTRGKYLYFSPEQIRMRPLDGRSDLFGLGAVLYEALVGVRAFDGELVDVLGAISRGELVEPCVRDPGLPAPLGEICLQALRVKREARWQTGEALATALEHWLHREAPTVSDAVVRDYLAHVASAELSEAVGHEVAPRPFPPELAAWARPLLAGSPALLSADLAAAALPTTAATPMTRLERTLRQALLPLLILAVAAGGFGLWWLVKPSTTTRFVGHRPEPGPALPEEPASPPPPEPRAPPPPPDPRPALPRLPERPADGSARQSEALDQGWILLRFELDDVLLDLSSLEPYLAEGPGEVKLEGRMMIGGEWMGTRKLVLVEETLKGRRRPRFVQAPGFEVDGSVQTLRFLLLNPSSYGSRRFVFPEGGFEAIRPAPGAPPIRLGPGQITDPWAHRLPYVRIDSNWHYEMIPRLGVPGSGEEAEREKATFLWVSTPVDLLQWGSRKKAGLTGDDLWGLIEEGETLRLDGIGAVWFALLDAPEGVHEGAGVAQFLVEVRQVGVSKIFQQRLLGPRGKKGRRR
ncbi:MAG: serine/threonine-protein kinase [Deltaproteobacteria bacterium]|nr:serine/threonine-protein kinase [Deltaproteobacteria bacterium]